MRPDAKFGTPLFGGDGQILELHGKVRLGDKVTWLGRKVGSCSGDEGFQVGQCYEVCFIYPSNHDIELQGNAPDPTIRAGESEYQFGQ